MSSPMSPIDRTKPRSLVAPRTLPIARADAVECSRQLALQLVLRRLDFQIAIEGHTL
jgi:hypothetical protein